MGWLWMCLGIRGKSGRRIGGRVSSDTYVVPQFDATKSPRGEDYRDYVQQPRQGYDGFGNGHSLPLGRNCDKDLRGGNESFKAEYGPYWGYSDALPAREEYVSFEYPRVPACARKSFSELLMETDTLEKGPLALAALAAAAERATRLKLMKEGCNSFPGFQVKEGTKAEVNESTMSSLSKDHVEASKAVAAFKERRRQSQLASSFPQTPTGTATSPSYISNLFRSSRKRALPFKSRTFQRPLSPVPEALAPDEIHRESDARDDISSPVMEPSPLGKSSAVEDWDDYVFVERIPEMPASENEGQSSIHGRISEEDMTSLQDDATSKVTLATENSGLDSESQQEDDSMLMRTPVRDILVTPEVFISPKTSSAEYNFVRVNDMDPEERPIFGSLADHWEAAWATKRPVWDGRGILNDTNKYSEDQKVRWHAVPFEERLAQALATQEDSVLQRRISYKAPTSRLSSTRTSRGLKAH